MGNKKIENKKGITLVVLVVSIVILLILTAVTIKITIGKNGILSKAMSTKNEEINKENSKNSEISQLYNKTTTTEVVNNVINTPGADNTPPDISIKDVKTNKFSVLITDEGSGVKYYAITTSNTEPATYTLVNPTSKTFSEDLTALVQNTTYYIWAKDANGNKSKSNLKTAIVPDLNSTNSTFTNNPNSWTNQNVTTTIATTVEDFILQYQIGSTSGSWTEYTTDLTIPSNTNVYARLWDGNNAGGSTYGIVSNIDRVAPTAPTYEAYFEDGSGTYTSGTWTNKKVRTKITTTEATSGVSQIQYSTDKTNWTNLNFSASSGIVANGSSYYGIEPWTLNNRNQTYYFRSVDTAGNISEISSAFNLKYDITAPSAPTLTNSSNSSWTTGDVTVTGSATDALSGIQGYQYSYDNSTWYSWGASSTWSSDIYTNFYTRAIDNAGNIGPVSSTVIKIDKTPPTITSVTEDAYYNFKSALTLEATDNVGIVEYGINTSSITQPTEWISVTNTDLTDVETKREFGASWAKVFYQNVLNGDKIFASDSEALNTNSDARFKWSILGKLINFKNSSNKYEFLLQYPNDSTGYNRWIQTDNPATVTIADGAATTTGGYSPVHIDWTTDNWGGLAKSTYTSSFLDGSIGNSLWYYAIGTKVKFQRGMPTSSSIGTDTGTVAELWARIDNITTATKATLKTKIGNITTNGTSYCVWVKDHLGNVSHKVVTVSHVDQSAPTINSLTKSNSSWTNSNITLTASATAPNSGLNSAPYSWNTDTNYGTSNTYSATTNGTYTVFARNAIGKESSSSITITNIDKTAPAVTVDVGVPVYKDENFASGTNSTFVYNNSANGSVTMNRIAMSTGWGSYALQMQTTGTSSPGWGGFSFATKTAANKTYIAKIVAKIPTGYTLNWVTNTLGTGNTHEWLTTQGGTNDWKEYSIKVYCGSSGTFSSTNYFYLTGGSTPTASSPLTWYIAYASVHDATNLCGKYNYITLSATDSQSGVKKYGINNSSGTTLFSATITPTNDFGTVYTGGPISANGTYTVWVEDVAGNRKNTTVTITRVLEVGDYVNYSPSGTTTSYAASASYTGYSASQTISWNTGIKWRIISVNSNDTVNLLSTQGLSRITLKGALGYNNGVYLLNAICSTLCSNSTLGASARNINYIYDIEPYISDTAQNTINAFTQDGQMYGNSKTYSSPYNYYPLRHPSFTNEYSSGSLTTDGNLYTNGQLTIKNTEFALYNTNANFTNQTAQQLLFTNVGNCWVATRFTINYNSYPYADFGIRFLDLEQTTITDRKLYGYGLVASNNFTEGDASYHVRPVVYLGTGIEVLGGTGTSTDMRTPGVSQNN